MIHNQNSLPRVFKGIALFTPGGDLIYCIDPNKQAHWHIHLCIGLQEILDLPEPPHFLAPGYTATVDRWFEAKTQKIITSAEIYPAVQRYQPLLRVLFATEELVWQIAPWQEEYCNPMMLETYRHQFPQLWENHNLIVRSDPSHHNRQVNVPRIKTVNYGDRLITRQELSTAPTDFSPHSKLKTNNQEQIKEKASNISLPATFPTINQNTESGFTYQAEETFPSVLPSSSTRKNENGYVLRLFISSDNAAIEKTLTKIHQLLEEGLTYPYTLKVIDISKHPEQAENYHISAIPTLVRVWPKPIRRVVGKLDDVERVVQIISSI